MTIEEFLLFCESINNADNTGNAGEAKIFFRAVHLGASDGAHYIPDDETVVEGYELGQELSRKL